ncbi:hypothetical protein BDA99DRAFT_514682 [Phascolomyces articulosus]|uniref:Shugoshin N-terminal coiled-coil domain-containing protein n=1 Tax=Phascolomyces articulosus TaxID=60185 RepID=A0AAD5PEB4_9FUNG|nr:hypothetical protein BDA99DRAFT_514682 [Phascolomyces articulosus]
MPNVSIKRIRFERSSHSTTGSTAEKLESFKRTHLKQNRELTRTNVIYASHIRKLENDVCTLKSENLELRARLIHVERQLELKEQECVMLTDNEKQQQQEEHEMMDSSSSSSSSVTNDATMTLTQKQTHHLMKNDTQSSLVIEDLVMDDSMIEKQDPELCTTTTAASYNSKQEQQLPSPATEECNFAAEGKKLTLHHYNDGLEKDDKNVQQLLSPPEIEEDSVLVDLGIRMAETMYQAEYLEDKVNSNDTDDDTMGYSVEPPGSPDIELLLEHQTHHNKLAIMNHNNKQQEKESQKQLLSSTLTDAEKQKDTISDGNKVLQQHDMISIPSSSSSAATMVIINSGSKRSKAPKNYALPSVKKKLRKGDPFTFDYQGTTT